jgi:hypothetical protein
MSALKRSDLDEFVQCFHTENRSLSCVPVRDTFLPRDQTQFRSALRLYEC